MSNDCIAVVKVYGKSFASIRANFDMKEEIKGALKLLMDLYLVHLKEG
jgi:hypothetical protein